MGGYLAALYAARHAEVSRLILLAPAFAFHDLWISQMPPADLARWGQTGFVDVFHYGAGKDMPLNYALLKDAAGYERYPAFRQPALIFHGEQDRSVPISYSVAFTKMNPNTRLIRHQCGHELTDVLDQIWADSEPFLLSGQIELEC
jgi:pimeloyl-ACP methyl ester carboxylesterase